MSAPTRRAEGRARMRLRPIEIAGVVVNLAIIGVLVAAGLDLVGIASPRNVAANTALAVVVIVAALLLVSLVVEAVRQHRTGTHAATRPVPPEPQRDILTEALAAIEESEQRFRTENPGIVWAPPADDTSPDDGEAADAYADLPDFARPVATHPPRAPRPVP